MKEASVTVSFETIQRYICKNRITKAEIKYCKIAYYRGEKFIRYGYFVSCNTHKETVICVNKTDAMKRIRSPWVWCDGCQDIHNNADGVTL